MQHKSINTINGISLHYIPKKDRILLHGWIKDDENGFTDRFIAIVLQQIILKFNSFDEIFPEIRQKLLSFNINNDNKDWIKNSTIKKIQNILIHTKQILLKRDTHSLEDVIFDNLG